MSSEYALRRWRADSKVFWKSSLCSHAIESTSRCPTTPSGPRKWRTRVLHSRTTPSASRRNQRSGNAFARKLTLSRLCGTAFLPCSRLEAILHRENPASNAAIGMPLSTPRKCHKNGHLRKFSPEGSCSFLNFRKNR